MPVVLIGSHSTLMELGVRLLGLYVDAGGMYRPLNDPFYHYWIKHHRARAATELIHYKDMRHTLRFLQAGGNLWYALDQDMGPRVSVFAPFSDWKRRASISCRNCANAPVRTGYRFICGARRTGATWCASPRKLRP